MKLKKTNVKEMLRPVVMLFIFVGMLMFSEKQVQAESTSYGTEIASGTCGATGNEDGITWTVYDSGADDDTTKDTGDTLVFSGNGAMADYSKESYAPWYKKYNSTITNIIFTEDSKITSIGDYAFFRFYHLDYITIPNEVEKIGKYAFYICHGLDEIVIPNGVKKIDYAAFAYCLVLKTVVIPESVEEISDWAFNGSTKLIIEVDENNLNYSSENGCLYNKDKSILLAYPTATRDFVVPESVKTIAGYAFYASRITSVTIPNEVDSIGKAAFYYCHNLKSLVIPKSVTSLGKSALYGCDKLEEFYYPSDLDVSSAEVPETCIQGSYVENEDGTIFLTITYLPSGTTTIAIPKEINGKPVSSVSYGEGVDSDGVTISCTNHFYGTSYEWQKDKDSHWFVKECSVCGNEGEVREAHTYGDGTQACTCGYIPFTITGQPKGKELVYDSESEEERKLTVLVSKTLGMEAVTYQWYENDVKIECATENTYVIPADKKASKYEYFCEISCGEYCIKSDSATVSIAKKQAEIIIEDGKEEVTLSYSRKPVVLEGITKTGDGMLTFTVTEGSDVLSAFEDGKVITLKPGIARISISMAETANCKEAETKSITITVIKASQPDTLPKTLISVDNTVKNVSAVSLPTNWQWSDEDAEKTLTAGEDIKVAANYVGEDKECYDKLLKTVTIQRAACEKSDDILYTGEGEEPPTCTEQGKGHKECTICGDVLERVTVSATGHSAVLEAESVKEATCKEEGYTGDMYCNKCGEKIFSGIKIDKLPHAWGGGVVTKNATETQTGIKTYTCCECGETKTEEIPALGKTEVSPTQALPTQVPPTQALPTQVLPTQTPPTQVPKEEITPDVPKEEIVPPPTPGTVKEVLIAPKQGTILIDKKNQVKYKVLVSDTKNGTVEYVKLMNKKATKVTVPAKVTMNGITYKVVSIGKNAFKKHKEIKKITIGSNVKTVGTDAFYGCKKLSTVSMGKNVTTIGNKAFYKCTALAKITIPSKVKKIGKQAFYGCKKLKNITIKSKKLTQKNVGSKAFKGIHKKATVKVPKSKVKTYKKLLKAKGITKKVKVKKI